MSLDRNLKFTDFKDMLKQSGDLYGDRPAYIFKTDKEGKLKTISHKEFRDDINYLGTSLIDIGLKNKRIAVISDNRYEWEVAYFAISAGTGVVVPLDKALPDNEIESLILRSEVEAIFYSDSYSKIMNEIRQRGISKIKYFISMDAKENTDKVYSQSFLTQKGKVLLESGNTEFIDAKIDSDAMGIMLFTSGTTDKSKAVMLSHKNICTNVMDIKTRFDLDEYDTMLSFLPLHHTFESTVGFIYPISIGCCIAFCEGIRHIADNIKEFQVTAMITVPILCETMYKKIMKGVEKKGKLKTIKIGMKISDFLLKFGIDIRRKLFKEIHDNLGGKLRLIVAGGAALDSDTEKGFNSLGINVEQGYGLTETSPVVAAETPQEKKIGSIGRAFPSLEVKIDNPNEQGIGELIVKGPTIMLGYYENEKATKETIDKDGWLHTGDLARIDKDGYIFVSGRKKDVIVLKNGKNVYPEELEALLNKIEGVKGSFVYGKLEDDGDVKICSKIVYDKESVQEVYNTIDENKIKDIMWKQIKEINKTIPTYKYIKELIVTDEDFIKTTTQKIKRHEELKKILK